jgi:tRNA (guanine37-N1)-methyltransferase
MDIDILTLFPDYFDTPFSCSMIKRAREAGLVNIRVVDIRIFAKDRHKTVDDRPYGGGPGMVMKVDVVVEAIQSVKREGSHVVYLSPQGRVLKAAMCEELAKKSNHLILLCGHYEGIDERIIELEVDEEISIGDFVLTSGGPAAIVLVDAVSRFIPGVLGHPDAAYKDSFHSGEIFEGPIYTRPAEFKGLKVPDVLLQGHHVEIEKWRSQKAKEKRKRVRPDLG